ncbi:hypothetical protein CWI38_0220p0040 [Hamiltosporidium tvaerminnensis]|uniref:Uncharacterized protein n=2 Tax=Hamiltosporidium TaxID=1176354 RepID=A0A4Q9KSH1_9MICR|nr:hypothetical protein CWI36_3116p0010 [Hamiltosporidium magnivora]TBU19111.1 hypothetical protein CWI38_0220p0040 [Hamiltosporidium tvaerminnensis]
MDREDQNYYKPRTNQRYSKESTTDTRKNYPTNTTYRYTRDTSKEHTHPSPYDRRRDNESMYPRNINNSYGRRYTRYDSSTYNKGVRVVRKGIPTREELDEQLIKYMRGE